ncbi:MAG: hypothetical protein M3P49_02740 [Actinomycetota bacterium]|nr:hypothetical protein [Actinomycetota bacterium]
MADLDRETRVRIEDAIRRCAEQEYPLVWVGEEGMTPEAWAYGELRNAETPYEEFRVSPGDTIRLEGDEGEGRRFRIPSVSNDWLPGDWVLEHVPHALREDRLDDLDREVMYLAAARRGLVPVMPRARARLAADLALHYQSSSRSIVCKRRMWTTTR